MVAYKTFPNVNTPQHRRQISRMLSILSAMMPKMGEKIIWPKASAATTNPYCWIVTVPSSYNSCYYFKVLNKRRVPNKRRGKFQFIKLANLLPKTSLSGHKWAILEISSKRLRLNSKKISEILKILVQKWSLRRYSDPQLNSRTSTFIPDVSVLYYRILHPCRPISYIHEVTFGISRSMSQGCHTYEKCHTYHVAVSWDF